MTSGLRILRQVTDVPDYIIASLRTDQHLIEYNDGTVWVDNDLARDVSITKELVLSGGPFIVADEQGGKIAGPYRALVKAEQARSGVKLVFAPVVEVDADVDEEPAAPEVGGRGKKS